MTIKSKFAGVAIATLILGCGVSASANAANLIANGDFETGDLTGWTLVDAAGGSGSWFVIGNGGAGPLSGFGTPVLAGGGDFTAMTDQTGPGDHDLSQTLLLGAGSYLLAFDARGSDSSGSGGAPDQQYVARVDGVDILGPLVDPDWRHFHFNLSLGAGAHTFAFHENDDRNFYEAGLDNVSLTSGGAPEPATWALMLGGFGLAGSALRRRAKPATA